MVEVVYEQQEEQADVDTRLVAAVDLGVNVLAALTSNKPVCSPLGQRQTDQKPQSVLQQATRSHQSQLSHEKRFTVAPWIGSRRSAIAASTSICTRPAVGSLICW